MINAGIVGISGYSGAETLKLLLKHPQVRVTYASANSTKGKVSDILPQVATQTRLYCRKYDHKKAVGLCDVLFLAVPHTVAMQIAPRLLKAGKKVIDLSGDYRLDKASAYQKWYGAPHIDRDNLRNAVFGLPELYREDIKKANLIANPGCYPTAALLSLIPITSLKGNTVRSITIDAKSGISGAGRKAHLALSFAECNENFKAYKVLHHQHVPEMELYLSKIAKNLPKIHFVPHLLPVNRGILETIYVQTKTPISLKDTHQMYKKFYKTEPFVRILDKGKQPELKDVTHTNYCDIGLACSEDNQLLVITSAIDNLVKGAAGQAVQNMNIMCGFKENEGL